MMVYGMGEPITGELYQEFKLDLSDCYCAYGLRLESRR